MGCGFLSGGFQYQYGLNGRGRARSRHSVSPGGSTECRRGRRCWNSTISATSSSTRRDGGGESSDETLLGGFEHGLDGWTAPAGVELEQVTDDDVPAGVASGTHALAAEVKSGARQTIANGRRVRAADFARTPYLGMHVLALAAGTNADLLFQLRVHSSPAMADTPDWRSFLPSGQVRRQFDGVWPSEWKAVTQLRPQEVQWDLSGLPSAVLEHATKLEIVWRPETPVSGTDEGSKSNWGPPYRSIVAFDEIRLYDTPPMSPIERLQQKRSNLHRKHGMIVDRRIAVNRDGYERGVVEYVDGTNVSYTFEVLGEDRYRYTIDGETFVIDGTGG